MCLGNSRSEGKNAVSFSALIPPSLLSTSVQGSLKKDRLISLESKSEWGAELGQSAGLGIQRKRQLALEEVIDKVKQ